MDWFIKKDHLPTWNQDYANSSINSSSYMLKECIGEVYFLFQSCQGKGLLQKDAEKYFK